MIKVYNKSTNYLKIGDKRLAPFKTETFEERTSQIRVLQRNGIISVSEILENNKIPQTDLTSNPEVKIEPAIIAEPVITEATIIESEVIPAEVIESTVESLEEIIPVKEVKEEVKEEPKAEKKVEKKSTKTASKKKGGKK